MRIRLGIVAVVAVAPILLTAQEPGPFPPPKTEPSVITPGKNSSDPPSDAIVLFNGQNLSRYISRDQAPDVQKAIDGYQKFQELTEQYAQAVIDKTRAELAANSKKKTYHLHRKSSLPKTKKSNS